MEMKKDMGKSKNESKNNAPRWTRRGFGIFAAIATAAAVLWRPKLSRRKAELSGVVADHWEPIAHKK